MLDIKKKSGQIFLPLRPRVLFHVASSCHSFVCIDLTVLHRLYMKKSHLFLWATTYRSARATHFISLLCLIRLVCRFPSGMLYYLHLSFLAAVRQCSSALHCPFVHLPLCTVPIDTQKKPQHKKNVLASQALYNFLSGNCHKLSCANEIKPND